MKHIFHYYLPLYYYTMDYKLQTIKYIQFGLMEGFYF